MLIRSFRRTRLALILPLVLGASLQVRAVDLEAEAEFDIPPQSLSSALIAFGRQSGIQIMTAATDVQAASTPGVHGRLSLHAALVQLLQGTGLRYRDAGEDSVTITPAGVGEEGRFPPAGREERAEGVPDRHGLRNEDQLQESTADRAGPPTDSSDVKDLDTIIVTRPFTDANVDIVRTENDVQPYYIFQGEDIAKANTVSVEDFLKQRLTMNTVSGTNSQQSGAFNPNSYVSLRGLDTLILVNGRRTGGSNDDFQFNLNAISPSQIERIEVLPSSASAIYGGSAIGGVLNIILKRDFTGGDVSYTYDTPLDSHAPVRSFSAGYGWGLEQGRTQVTFRATHNDSRDVLRLGDRRRLMERGFSRLLALAPQLVNPPGDPHNFGTTPNIGSTEGEPLVFKEGGPLGGTSLGSAFTFVPVGTSPGISLADLQAVLLANAGRQNTDLPEIISSGVPNTGLLTPLSTPAEAYSVMGAVRRKMTDRLELIAETYYNSSKVVAHRPADTYFYVPAESPANPFQQDVYVPSPLAGAAGLRTQKIENFRAVAGFVLDLPGDWRAQGDYTWNRTRIPGRSSCFDCASGGQRSAEALANGTLNPFVDTLAYPLDLSPYLTAADMEYVNRITELTDTGLRASGPVGMLPAGRPNLTVGLGHREEKRPSYSTDHGGYGRYTFFPQSQRVSSLYVEGLVPLLKQVPGVRLLELQVASRLEDFSVNTNGGSYTVACPSGVSEEICMPTSDSFVPEVNRTSYRTITETLGLRYQPVDSLTLRASYATGFLPPRLDQLHPSTPDPIIYEWGPDPLRGGEQVRARTIFGGNPDLDPMDSRSINLGLIFQPNFWGLEGLRMGLEWFRIDRENMIWAPSGDFLMANQERFADRIVRAAPEPGDPYGVGPITLIDLSAMNANKVSTKGFDISLGYNRPTERRGTFTLELLTTVVKSYTVALDLDGNTEEVAGQAADQELGYPLKLRANATLGWERGPWGLSWTALYYGPYDQVNYDDGAYIAVQGRTTVPHQLYHNLLASYRFADAETSGRRGLFSDLTLTLGIRNVFNTLPPLDAYNGRYGYYSFFGDPRLRSVQLSVRKAF